MEIFLFWIIGGVVVAIIANSKGKGTFGWFVYGFLLFPVALVHVLVSPRNAAVVAEREVQSGTLKKCPHCAELIKVDARVCRYCQRDV